MSLAPPSTAGVATGATPAAPGLGIVAPSWRRTIPVLIAAVDLVTAVAAVFVALRFRYGGSVPDLFVGRSPVSYERAALLTAVAWPGVLAAHGAYRSVVAGDVADQMGRVVEAGLTLVAALAVLHLLLETSLSWRLVIVAVLLLVGFGLLVRLVADVVIRHGRTRRGWRRRAVVYGSSAEATALARHFARPGLSVDVVGTCLADRTDAGRIGVGDAALRAMSDTGADVLAVAGGTSPAEVRSLAWALEGTGAELLIAPAVPDLAQQRVVVETLGDVVALRVEECRQRRGRLLVKSALDRVLAAVLLVVLAPVFLAVALAVKLTSPGPVLFRQERAGQFGTTFEFLKFRTMGAGAEARVDELADHNESDGLLFKVHDDPRVTPVGRHLRRTSLDELPQLWNVLRGDMSLVGPRPLPVDAEEFQGDARRRLRVRPGITGLWQVSGRSDLGWEDTVALDMFYVDHWSLGLDLAILVRTPLAVLRGRGAY